MCSTFELLQEESIKVARWCY